MTTLPQTTTSVRVPRQVAAGQLTTTSAGLPALVGGSGAGQSMSGNDVWRVLRGNIWLIMGMLVCAGVLGYVANYFLAKNFPRYTAVGYLEVNPMAGSESILNKSVANVQDAGNVALEQKSQAQLLGNESLLTKVLQNKESEIRKTNWFKKFNNNIALAKEDFRDNYSVIPLPETRLVKVEFTNALPEECKTMVDEIVEQHIKDQQEIGLFDAQGHSRELKLLESRTRAQISANEATLGQYRNTLSNEGGAGGVTRISIKEMQLEQLIQMETTLDLKSKALLADLEQDNTQLRNGVEPPAAMEMMMMDTQLQMLRSEKQNLEQNLDQLTETLGPKSQRVMSTQKLLTRVTQQLADAEAEARLRYRNVVLDKKRLQVATAKNDFDLMHARVDELQASLGELSNTVAKYFTLLEEDKGLREKLKRITDNLDLALTQQQSQLTSKIIWRARPVIPSNRSFPKLGYTMTLALAVGLMLSLGIAFLREVTDTSVRSERDIARVGHMTLLGMIADESDDPQATGARLPLVIFDAPHSMTAEQLRQVRTRLQHAASLDSTGSIMITSAAPGDGKTTIACNLAAGLALNGRRILLVDGNFRRPEIHRVFGIGNDRGFSDVLNGAVAFEDVVQETQVPNLSVMTSGPKPINATEMFESQLLVDFIGRALEEFDHVIFDSGPLMVVSESAAMAPRVDGVVTVVRARGSNRGQLARMRDGLRATKAEHLGVVLNGVRAQGGGYYGRNIKTYYEYQNG